MSGQKHNKVFLSDVCKDDQPFVQRLYSDLQRLGYDAWIEKEKSPAAAARCPVRSKRNYSATRFLFLEP